MSAASWPGSPGAWHGFERYDFNVDERPCRVVVPANPAPGRPWVWRARFPEYHTGPDRILLKRGFHVAYINTDGMLGSPRALTHWDSFYDTLVYEYGLASRPALVAVSRGGLSAYRWAARHPKRIACIYADTPVCDIRSWPLGQGQGVGHPDAWQALLREYSFTHEEALLFDRNPVEVLQPLAEAGVPLLHIVSLNDRVVPPCENSCVVRDRYRALGGVFDMIEVEEGTETSNGHHFEHPDPLRVADFIERHASVPPGSEKFLCPARIP